MSKVYSLYIVYILENLKERIFCIFTNTNVTLHCCIFIHNIH